MSHHVDRSKLSLMIFPTRFPLSSYLLEYQKSYACWRSVWNQALKEEMNVKEDLYSDSFTKHTHILTVFYEGEVAGLMTLNYMNLAYQIALDDSYFKVWPEFTLMKLKKEAKNIIVTGSFTVSFNFRKKAYGLCWKSLVCAFLVRHLKSSVFDCAVATPRLEKSVEKICYGTGAHPLYKDLPYTIEGQRIDLVSWHRNLDESIIDPEIWELVNYVWKNSSTVIETVSYRNKEKNMLPSYKTSVSSMSYAIRNYPWNDKLAYAEFLAQTYYYICHSTRLLAASAARFSQQDQGLHKRFLKHTDEENSHELLALRDLQKLGYNILDFPEMPQTKTFYEIQYYKIEHCDPAAVMGYILALESVAANDLKWLNEKLTALYGKECAKLIQVHADDDPDHVEKALQLINGLHESRLSEININIEQTAHCYNNILDACQARAGGKIKKAA